MIFYYSFITPKGSTRYIICTMQYNRQSTI